MKYQLTKNGIIDVLNQKIIPNDPKNIDWNEYLNWLDEGNVPDEEYTSEQKKRYKKQELTEARKEYLEEGVFEFQGNTFATDEETRNNISGIVAFVATGSSLPPGFTWRDVDNNDISMNNTTVIEFGSALVAHVNTAYKKNWVLKAQVDAIDDDDPEIDSKLEDIVW